MKRKPVNSEKYQLFQQWLRVHVSVYGVDDDSEVVNCFILLDEALDKARSNSDGLTVSKKRKIMGQKQKFVAIFKKRYAQEVESEYNFTSKDNVHVDRAVKLLEERKFKVEEYLDWFFDDKLVNSSNLTPGVGLACASKMMDEFFYKNKDLKTQREEEERTNLLIADLANRVRAIYRETKDESIRGLLTDFNEGRILLETLRMEVDKREVSNA